MNKLFTKIGVALVGIAMAVGVGVAVGQKSEVKSAYATNQTATLSQSSSTANYTDTKGNTWTSSKTADTAISVDASTWLKVGSGTKAATSISLETTAYNSVTIKTIEVHVKAKANTASYGYIFIGDDQVKKSSLLSNTDTSISYDNSTAKKSGKITVACTRDSSANGALYLGTVVVTYDDGSSAGVMTINPSNVEVPNGASKTINVAYENLTSDITIAKTSGAGAVTLSTNTLTVASTASANQNFTITGSTNGDLVLTLTSGETSETINVTVCATTTYTKVLDIDKLYNGQSILITNLSGSKSLGAQKYSQENMTNRDAVDNTIVVSNDIYLKNDSLATRITVGIKEESDGTIHYSFYDNTENATGYLKGGHADKKLVTAASISESGALWTISIDGETGSASVISNGNNDAKNMRFNTNLFNCYSSGQDDIAIFARYDDVTNAQVVASFVTRYMKMESIPTSNVGTTAGCSDNWTAASAAYDKLNDAQKLLFVGGGYANAASRFDWWAKANGATFNTTTGALTPAASRINTFFDDGASSNTSIIIIIIISTTALLAVGGYFLLRRKHDDR